MYPALVPQESNRDSFVAMSSLLLPSLFFFFFLKSSLDLNLELI